MDLFSDWATVYIHWPILIELCNHLQLNLKLLTGGWLTPTHLFAQHNPMPCWPMSILGPNSVLIDSSHCWWMPWWVQASKPACFSLMCQMSIDRSPPASLNIKMLTPKPHLSHLCLYTASDTNTRVRNIQNHQMHVKSFWASNQRWITGDENSKLSIDATLLLRHCSVENTIWGWMGAKLLTC